MVIKKAVMRVPRSQLVYGRNKGVTLKEAKRAYLSGMSNSFRKKVKVIFAR